MWSSSWKVQIQNLYHIILGKTQIKKMVLLVVEPLGLGAPPPKKKYREENE